MSTEVDLGFDYEGFFKWKKINPRLRLPRELAYDDATNRYAEVFAKVGDSEFVMSAPHNFFSQGLETEDERWVVVDALRGEMFKDHDRLLRVKTQAGRYTIVNPESGVRLSGIFDSTSPLKFVLEVLPATNIQAVQNRWLLDGARTFINGKSGHVGHMDSVNRIRFERDNINYWTSVIDRLVTAHLGSLASERQRIMAA